MIISIRELFRYRDDARDLTRHGDNKPAFFLLSSIPQFWIWRFTLRGSNSNVQAPSLAEIFFLLPIKKIR